MRKRFAPKRGLAIPLGSEKPLVHAANAVRDPSKLPGSERPHLGVDVDLALIRWDSEAHVDQSADRPYELAVLSGAATKAKARGQVDKTDANARRLPPKHREP